MRIQTIQLEDVLVPDIIRDTENFTQGEVVHEVTLNSTINGSWSAGEKICFGFNTISSSVLDGRATIWAKDGDGVYKNLFSKSISIEWLTPYDDGTYAKTDDESDSKDYCRGYEIMPKGNLRTMVFYATCGTEANAEEYDSVGSLSTVQITKQDVRVENTDLLTSGLPEILAGTTKKIERFQGFPDLLVPTKCTYLKHLNGWNVLDLANEYKYEDGSEVIGCVKPESNIGIYQRKRRMYFVFGVSDSSSVIKFVNRKDTGVTYGYFATRDAAINDTTLLTTEQSVFGGIIQAGGGTGGTAFEPVLGGGTGAGGGGGGGYCEVVFGLGVAAYALLIMESFTGGNGANLKLEVFQNTTAKGSVIVYGGNPGKTNYSNTDGGSGGAGGYVLLHSDVSSIEISSKDKAIGNPGDVKGALDYLLAPTYDVWMDGSDSDRGTFLLVCNCINGGAGGNGGDKGKKGSNGGGVPSSYTLGGVSRSDFIINAPTTGAGVGSGGNVSGTSSVDFGGGGGGGASFIGTGGNGGSGGKNFADNSGSASTIGYGAGGGGGAEQAAGSGFIDQEGGVGGKSYFEILI
jgi:hypothetical protein